MRTDISKYLVHWTRGMSEEEAFENLVSIIRQRKINGGSELRRGNFTTVCFTEAPRAEFSKYSGRYSGFGIQVSKKWVFSMGGRPVIYQRDSEFSLLPPELQWRHVKYEPDLNPPIDFSWEREWRVLAPYMELEEQETVIIVPKKKWGEHLESIHKSDEGWRIFGEEYTYGEWYAFQHPNPFPFRIDLCT